MASNVAAVKARFNRVPAAVRAALEPVLKKEVEDLVAAQQRAAPVGGVDDPTPGKFRDSIHSYPTPNRPLSFRIIADARDIKGEFVASHIEYGHRSVGGGHVHARPSFWPTYRARRKMMRNHLNKASRDAIKTL